MSRRTRVYLPGLPYHIVQYGNEQKSCFMEADNYQYYLDLWKAAASRYDVLVHAYCIMQYNVHLIVTPLNETAVAKASRVVSSCYAKYINRRYHRSGSLWSGRYRASLIQSEKYLLTSCRYVELRPVVQKLVKQPEDYRWSSYGFNAWGDDSWVVPHEEYLKLGDTQAERCANYRSLFKGNLKEDDVRRIDQAVQFSYPTCDKEFKRAIEKKYGVDLGYAKRGRPRNSEKFALS